MRRPLAVAVALVALCLPAVVQADGDPASDILLGQDVFYPYAPHQVSPPLQKALNGVTAAAKKKGFPVKVAIIASSGDMGSVPQLFTDPQRYADLLTQEISFNSKPRVLVVMPSGIGGNNLGDDAGPALTTVTVPSDAASNPDELAQTALTALGKLTKAAGKPVPVPRVTIAKAAAKSKSKTSPLIVFGVPVLLVALAAAAAAARSRGREDEDSEE